MRLIGDTIDLSLVALAVVLIGVMTVNVAARAALNTDLAWNVEFGEFVLVWATFLGGAAAARRGGHIRISEIVTALPARSRRAVEALTRLGVLILLTVLVWKGMVIALSQMDQEMSVLYWPVGLQYAAMPIGSGLAALFVAYELWRIVRGQTLSTDLGTR